MAETAPVVPPALVLALAKVPPSSPLTLVNLLRFKPSATYAAGVAASGAGAEAYRRYLQELLPSVERAGGRVIYFGEVAATLFAPAHERWDAVLMIEYPSVEHFMRLLLDPQYVASVPHREAALADTRALGLCASSLPSPADP